MFQLVYISTARQPITEPELASILDVSRLNNAGAGITGLLVAGARRFLQALEGPEQAVLDTYARIRADPRHFGMVLLTGRSVDAPAFGEWTMGFEKSVRAETDGALLDIVDSLTASLSDKSLRAHFMGFAELHARAA